MTEPRPALKPQAGTIRGIIYDLDGTLYTVSWLKLNVTVGMPFDTKKLRFLFKARDAIRDQQFDSRKQLIAAMSKALAERAGGTPDAVERWYETRFMPRFVKVLKQRGQRRDNLIPLLERTRAKGVKQAVVSDFGRVTERLEALGIPPNLFDDIIGAEELGVMKPSEVPYRHLADKWQLPLSAILLVGDRRDQDEMSARLAKAAFVGIADQTPDDVFLEWPEVMRVIEGCTVGPQ